MANERRISSQPYLQFRLHGRNVPDAALNILPPRVFSPRLVGRSRVCFFLNQEVLLRPIVMTAAEYIRLPSVKVYELRVGSNDGIVVGMGFHSPLQCRVDTYYVMYYRPQFDPEHALRTNTKAKKKYDVGNLMFYYMEDEAVLITKMEFNKVTEMLEA